MKSISSKKRYAEKLKLVDGIDPYEVTKVIGKSHRLVASNHATSGVYVPHPSSECLLRKGFPQLQKPVLRGWVKQVLVNPFRDKRIVIETVSRI